VEGLPRHAYEWVVVASGAGRTIGPWERAVGIDAAAVRDRLLAKVKEIIARFEARQPSPPKAGRLR
jgi:hypothetical protein